MWFLTLGFLWVVSASNAWFTQFKPGREYWISPSVSPGTGDGSEANPFSFESAAAQQRGEGVMYWLLPGNYTSESGTFVIECNGQLNRPCVFRCVEDHACVFKGAIEIRASEAWLWGVKITELDSFPQSPCPISIGSTPPNFYVRVHVINNLVNAVSSPGVGRYGMCFSNDIGTVVYGNIVYGESPNLNISNSYAIGNYKYVVANMFLDPVNGTNINAVVDAHTDGMGEVSGLYFAKNIFSKGAVRVGSKIGPDYQNVFLSNQFVDSSVDIGISQPGQFQVVDNKFIRTSVTWPRMWGKGEEQYPEKQQLISSFTKNVLMGDVPGDAVRFGVGVYKKDIMEKDETYFVKAANIRNDTIWDNNNYFDFSAIYDAHGVFESELPSRKWRSLTKIGGREFDIDSTFNITLPRAQYLAIANEYDYTRVHLSFYVFYSEILPVNITFDLCCFLDGASWKLYDYTEIGASDPSYSSDDTQCEAVTIRFDGVMSRFFILKAEQDITLDRCPEGNWIADTELKLEIVSPQDDPESPQTLISAIVGAIVFAAFIAISVFYYRQKHVYDLEWKMMKEREAQEAESESL